jgi:hypothetical protein
MKRGVSLFLLGIVSLCDGTPLNLDEEVDRLLEALNVATVGSLIDLPDLTSRQFRAYEVGVRLEGDWVRRMPTGSVPSGEGHMVTAHLRLVGTAELTVGHLEVGERFALPLNFTVSGVDATATFKVN